MTDSTVRVDDDVKERLEAVREAEDHDKLSDAIATGLDAYEAERDAQAQLDRLPEFPDAQLDEYNRLGFKRAQPIPQSLATHFYQQALAERDQPDEASRTKHLWTLVGRDKFLLSEQTFDQTPVLDAYALKPSSVLFIYRPLNCGFEDGGLTMAAFGDHSFNGYIVNHDEYREELGALRESGQWLTAPKPLPHVVTFGGMELKVKNHGVSAYDPSPLTTRLSELIAEHGQTLQPGQIPDAVANEFGIDRGSLAAAIRFPSPSTAARLFREHSPPHDSDEPTEPEALADVFGTENLEKQGFGSSSYDDLPKLELADLQRLVENGVQVRTRVGQYEFDTIVETATETFSDDARLWVTGHLHPFATGYEVSISYLYLEPTGNGAVDDLARTIEQRYHVDTGSYSRTDGRHVFHWD